MPKVYDSRRTANLVLDDTLKEAFKKIERFVCDHVAQASSSAPSLALLRLLPGITAEEWETLARSDNLVDWLYFPLHRDIGETVRHLLDIQKRLIHESDHDSLTGIYNRRFFDRCLEIEVERAIRSQTELSLLYIDIDNFKEVNDKHGHGAGDKVLTRLAQLLVTSVRQYDVVVRLGGDEFIVVLPTSSCWTGVMMGNRLLEIFRNTRFESDSGGFSMTFSAGVSSLALCEEQHGGALLKSADQAMYDAKHKGKNSVVLACNGMKAKGHASLVQAREKRFLFMGLDSESADE